MTYTINETHDPNLRSWVESANDPNTDFPIQNLPFCIFSKVDGDDLPRVGVAIGNQILDVYECCMLLPFSDSADVAALDCEDSLNSLISLGPKYRTALREQLSRVLIDAEVGSNQRVTDRLLTPMK